MFTVVMDWMAHILNLSGNELLVFAVVYGFSQDGESFFIGGHKILADFLNITKENARLNLSKLVDKGLVEKKEQFIGGIKFCHYRANLPAIQKMGVALNQCHPDIKSMATTPDLMVTTPKSMAIDINKDINKKEYKRISISNDIDKKAPKKGTYGSYENVKLTDEEYEKFSAECPQAETYIERLSEYIAMKNPAYKSHLAVLRNWYRRDSEKGTVQGKEKVDPFMEELARLYEEGLD